MEIPDSGLLCDLLWADPDQNIQEWDDNERGVSYTFGSKIIEVFIKKHDFDLICRGHQVVEDGYEFFNSMSLVTIFSAPNYCGEFDNSAGIMTIDENMLCSFQILKPTENVEKTNIITREILKKNF